MTNKDIRICTIVTGKSVNEFLKNLEEIQKITDFVELRVDYIRDLSVGNLTDIKKKTAKKAIFTCRKKEDGGYFAGSENERKKIIEKAHALHFDYIDIEVSSTKQFETLIKESKTRIILSYHNFIETPPLKELENIKLHMKHYPNIIMKFATNSKNDKDIKTLFSFLLEKKNNEEMIIVGIGDKGKVIRVVGPLLGSYCTYASTPFSQSAPGQIDVTKLKEIYYNLTKAM